METINSFDILIALIKACQKTEIDKDRFLSGPDDYEGNVASPFYLLNQTVRQLWNRKGHKCVSKKALELWNKLKVGKCIYDFYYQMPIEYKNEEPVHIKIYVGAAGTPSEEKDVVVSDKNSFFRFRQVFHKEHIVPIGIILKQLLEIDLSKDKDEVYKKIDEILNKIYICYMLKEEDRALNKIAKTKRSDDYLHVINTDYKKAGIEIAEWENRIVQ